jgi:hypothetical protein
MFDWRVFPDALGSSDIHGIPYECFKDGYRLFADHSFWTVTERDGNEVAYGEGSQFEAEEWLKGSIIHKGSAARNEIAAEQAAAPRRGAMPHPRP